MPPFCKLNNVPGRATTQLFWSLWRVTAPPLTLTGTRTQAEMSIHTLWTSKAKQGESYPFLYVLSLMIRSDYKFSSGDVLS